MYMMSFHLVAEVGLQKSLYTVREEEKLLEVCVVVTKPSIECPVQFSFDVHIWTEDKDGDDKAGKSVPCVRIILSLGQDVSNDKIFHYRGWKGLHCI